ncbi:hypothetical protein KKA33_01935 [Patescibacteria group bacterium]|nr:hypothetical protein [Patescibacteria group bacterium]
MADDDIKDDVATEETPAEEKVEDVKEDGGYQFDDDLTSSEPSEAPAPASAGGRGGKYADEIFSKTIHAKFRTFYVDLKESTNGKFVKVSEKSHGRKSTIMMDAEDVPAMIEALQEVQAKL